MRADFDLFAALIDGADEWMRRVIHGLAFASAEHVRITSEYQCEFPASAVLGEDAADSARILLPLTTRDKSPLLNFDIEGSEGSPHLLPRSELAVLQARHLEHLIQLSGPAPALTSAFPRDLLVAICVFSPDVFRAFTAKRKTRTGALEDYLSGGLDFEVSRANVDAWLATALSAGYNLPDFLDEPPDRTFTEPQHPDPLLSSSECVLLALPKLATKPSTTSEVTALLNRFDVGIAAMKMRAQGGDVDASLFLSTLAEYGRRWLVVLDIEIPLDAPMTLKVADDRPLDLRFRGRTTHRLAFREGASVHVEARTLDPAARLSRRFRITDVYGARVGIGPIADAGGRIGPLELARSTNEVIALYSSEPARPQFVDFSVRLVPARDVNWPPILAMLLTLAACTAVALVKPGTDLVDSIAVLTVPTTFAATFALIREQTTLATRLRRVSNALLGFSVVLLWVIVIARLLTPGVDLEWLHGS